MYVNIIHWANFNFQHRTVAMQMLFICPIQTSTMGLKMLFIGPTPTSNTQYSIPNLVLSKGIGVHNCILTSGNHTGNNTFLSFACEPTQLYTHPSASSAAKLPLGGQPGDAVWRVGCQLACKCEISSNPQTVTTVCVRWGRPCTFWTDLGKCLGAFQEEPTYESAYVNPTRF